MDIFLLTFLGIWAVVIGEIGIITSEKVINLIIFYLILIAGVIMLAIMPYKAEKETAIKCLQGNNPYKMEIQYELRDSMYIPVDTIYVKIK